MLTQFHWIVPGLLAGAGRPGLLAPAEEDWRQIAEANIRLIVSLTEEALEAPPHELEVERIHFPVCDMGTPTSTWATLALCHRIHRSMEAGEPVLVHCKAGVGRTGTILACVLILTGLGPEQAVAEIRRTCNRYIESRAQEEFVRHFARFRGRADGGEGSGAGKTDVPSLRGPADA